jgi:hypothetical protein
MLKQMLILIGASAFASSLLAAPIAADIIAYRTEDGVFAYTDDHDKVPARYAHDAVTVRDANLQNYPRLTVEDTESARAVSSRLEKRLDYLRQVNAATAAEREVAATTATHNTVISIPTGMASGSLNKNTKFAKNTSSPSIEVSANAADGPIVIEPILTKQDGRATTRRATVVKQGGKILAITKSRSRHVDVNSDIYDEDELERR